MRHKYILTSGRGRNFLGVLMVFFGIGSFRIFSKRRGQVSIEYLGITAFFLVASGIFFSYSLMSFGDNKNIALAEDSVSKIVNNANFVSSLGNGSKVYFDVELPDGTEAISTSGKIVRIPYSGGMAAYAYAKTGFAESSVSAAAGRRRLSVSFIDGNVVVQ